MKFIESIEIEEWCGKHGIAFTSGIRPAIDASLVHSAKIAYANGHRSGREQAVAQACVQALGSWDKCLLWVTGWSVWPSGEDWPRYYAARGARGERRSLDKAPGHLFDSAEARDIEEFVALILENGWDAFLAPVVGSAAPRVLMEVSHDEWVKVHGVDRVVLATIHG